MHTRFLRSLVAVALALGTFNMAHGYGAAVTSPNAHYLYVRELASTGKQRWMNLGTYGSHKACASAAVNILKLEETWMCAPIHLFN